jgi:hypothetical protein
MNRSLLMAWADRWRLDTHRFHLVWGRWHTYSAYHCGVV